MRHTQKGSTVIKRLVVWLLWWLFGIKTLWLWIKEMNYNKTVKNICKYFWFFSRVNQSCWLIMLLWRTEKKREIKKDKRKNKKKEKIRKKSKGNKGQNKKKKNNYLIRLAFKYQFKIFFIFSVIGEKYVPQNFFVAFLESLCMKLIGEVVHTNVHFLKPTIVF